MIDKTIFSPQGNFAPCMRVKLQITQLQTLSGKLVIQISFTYKALKYTILEVLQTSAITILVQVKSPLDLALLV